MPWSHSFGAVAALFFFVVIVTFSGTVELSKAPSAEPLATSTLAVLKEALPSPAELQSFFPSLPATTPARTATTSAGASKPAASAPPKPPAPISYTQADLEAASAKLRAALVNIICIAPPSSGVRSISGSGVIIDPEGIFLTNAHIAQFFLLADRGVSCHIRTGGPAKDAYRAELVFISEAWVRTNARLISDAEPTGTGEYDFALVAISGSMTAGPLPSPFPHVPLATRAPTVGTTVVIGSYGAQFLESNQIASSLFPTIVLGSVKDVFTFGINTVDIVALGGSVAAQEGSSGGGFVDPFGTLAGTITTSTTEGDTSTRNVNALTASYIRADYASETAQAIDLLLAQATSTAVANFALKIPALREILVEKLK